MNLKEQSYFYFFRKTRIQHVAILKQQGSIYTLEYVTGFLLRIIGKLPFPTFPTYTFLTYFTVKDQKALFCHIRGF